MASHEMKLQYTDHARQRMAQRGITEQDIAEVIRIGLRIRKAGVIFYFMRRKDCHALHGLTVVQAKNGTVLTTYKNKRGLRDIKRKSKYLSKEMR